MIQFCIHAYEESRSGGCLPAVRTGHAYWGAWFFLRVSLRLYKDTNACMLCCCWALTVHLQIVIICSVWTFASWSALDFWKLSIHLAVKTEPYLYYSWRWQPCWWQLRWSLNKVPLQACLEVLLVSKPKMLKAVLIQW